MEGWGNCIGTPERQQVAHHADSCLSSTWLQYQSRRATQDCTAGMPQCACVQAGDHIVSHYALGCLATHAYISFAAAAQQSAFQNLS